jgi:alkylated DNA repair dioxygenase AlkB/nicotinamidase-related amidase
VTLLLIDLQPSILNAPNKRALSAASLVEPLSILLDAAREARHLIIWAWRDAIPTTHDPSIAPLIHPSDRHITHATPSALHAALPHLHDDEPLYLAGVMTHDAILATARDAAAAQIDVHVLSDCCASARASDHRDALKRLSRDATATIEAHVIAMTRWRSIRRDLGAGDTAVHYGALPDSLARDAFGLVRDEVRWQQMYHRGGLVPRLVCLQGSVAPDGTHPLYRHPADEQPPLEPWTPTVDALRRHVEAMLNQPLNHALIQRYTGGGDYISPHADKTLDITRSSAIIGLSLGATRSIILRSKLPDPSGHHATQTLELPHGSLFVLGWDTNQRWAHGIRQDGRTDQERREDELRDDAQRISLTMRSVATFLSPDRTIWGQGARRKRREDPPPAPRDAAQQARDMLIAFREENQRDDFDWDAHYGPGFDILDLSSLS